MEKRNRRGRRKGGRKRKRNRKGRGMAEGQKEMTEFAFVDAGAVTATSYSVILDEIVRVFGVNYSRDLFTNRFSDAQREAVGTYRQQESAPAPTVDPTFEILTRGDPYWDAGSSAVLFDWMVAERDLEQARDLVNRQIVTKWESVRAQGVNGAASPVDARVFGTTNDALVLLFENSEMYRKGVKATDEKAVVSELLAPDDPFVGKLGNETIFNDVYIPVLQMHDAADERLFDLGKDAKLAADRAELEAVRDAIATGWPPPPVYS